MDGVFFISLYGMISFIVWVLVNAWFRRQQVKQLAEFNSHLLRRVETFRDFSEFLQTDGGSTFLDRLTGGGPSSDVRAAILRAVQTGIVLLSLGVGLLILAWMLRSRFPYGDSEVFTICGVISLSLGVGFVLSGGAAYRLASGMQRRNDG